MGRQSPGKLKTDEGGKDKSQGSEQHDNVGWRVTINARMNCCSCVRG